MNTILSLQNVSKTYHINRDMAVEAVRNVELDVERGDFLVITGRSGSGKTTLLNLMGGLARPTAGQVVYDGINIVSLLEKKRSLLRSQKIGFIFQFPSLLPSLTVLENVVLPTMFVQKQQTDDVYERGKELLQTVGLIEKLNVYPRQLSAGQQQRVVIARSLINNPEVLLADEPTSDLDEKTEREIILLFREIFEQLKVTIVMVTHTSELIPYGTRSIEMANGTIRHSAYQIMPQNLTHHDLRNVTT